jgi:hypothetical protein
MRRALPPFVHTPSCRAQGKFTSSLPRALLFRSTLKANCPKFKTTVEDSLEIFQQVRWQKLGLAILEARLHKELGSKGLKF